MIKILRPVLGAAVMLALMPIAACAQEESVPCITLDEAIATALANNPSVAIAREQVERSRAQIREAAARGLPQVSAEATYSRTEPVEIEIDGGRIQIVPESTTTITGRVTQAADVFGRVRLGVDLAETQTEIQRLDLARVEQTVVLDVKNAYYNVLRAASQRNVAQAAVDVAQERLRLAQAGFEAGTLARFDVASAEVQVASLRQGLIATTNATEVARAALANVMGIEVTTRFAVQDVTPTVTPPDVLVEQAIEAAYAQRPEVLAAQEAVDLQQTAVALTRKERLPLLGLFATTERNLNPGAFGVRDTWRVGANMTWSIWAGGATEARVRQVESDLRAAEDRLQQTRLAVGLDVQTAVVSLTDASERVTVAGDNVRLAEEALRLAQVRYQAGISTAIEVTSAEADLTQARTNEVNVLYDYQTALARLQRAMGITQGLIMRLD